MDFAAIHSRFRVFTWTNLRHFRAQAEHRAKLAAAKMLGALSAGLVRGPVGGSLVTRVSFFVCYVLSLELVICFISGGYLGLPWFLRFCCLLGSVR